MVLHERRVVQLQPNRRPHPQHCGRATSDSSRTAPLAEARILTPGVPLLPDFRPRVQIMSLVPTGDNCVPEGNYQGRLGRDPVVLLNIAADGTGTSLVVWQPHSHNFKISINNL